MRVQSLRAGGMRRAVVAMGAAIMAILVTAVAGMGTAGATPGNGKAAAGTIPGATLVKPSGVGPESHDFMSSYLYSIAHPGVMPQGVNNYGCRSKEHPNPVVLVHGTWDSAYGGFAMLAPELKRAGYCLFAMNYGNEDTSALGLIPGIYGTGDLMTSSRDVAKFVDSVIKRTGAKKVDLIGHSQGGIHTRMFVQDYGGANAKQPLKNKVDKVIGLAADNHGTTLSGIAAIGGMLQDWGIPVLDVTGIPLGLGGVQQAIGSPAIRYLNRNGDTRPGIEYTMIATRYDWNVTPYSGAFLAHEANSSVHNITLQDGCAADYSEHLSITFDPRAIWYVKAALDPSVAANSKPPCGFVAPFFGAVGK